MESLLRSSPMSTLENTSCFEESNLSPSIWTAIPN